MLDGGAQRSQGDKWREEFSGGTGSKNGTTWFVDESGHRCAAPQNPDTLSTVAHSRGSWRGEQGHFWRLASVLWNLERVHMGPCVHIGTLKSFVYLIGRAAFLSMFSVQREGTSVGLVVTYTRAMSCIPGAAGTRGSGGRTITATGGCRSTGTPPRASTGTPRSRRAPTTTPPRTSRSRWRWTTAPTFWTSPCGHGRQLWTTSWPAAWTTSEAPRVGLLCAGALLELPCAAPAAPQLAAFRPTALGVGVVTEARGRGLMRRLRGCRPCPNPLRVVTFFRSVVLDMQQSFCLEDVLCVLHDEFIKLNH